VTLINHKIRLADYDYQSDISLRLFLSRLTVFEIEVLREVVDNSLSFSTIDLADLLEVQESDLIPVLERFASVELLTVEGSHATVNKEKRKLFEAYLDRFEEGFEPDVAYLFSSLKRVPNHVLLEWYSIPRMADKIEEAIVEKYFLTPKTYEKYLHSIQFESSVINDVKAELFASSTLELDADEIQARYGLGDEPFEELLIELELNLIAYLSYLPQENLWKRVLRPYAELRNYLLFRKRNQPDRINVHPEGASDEPFIFLSKLSSVLTVANQQPLPVTEEGVDLAFLYTWIPELSTVGIYEPETFFQMIFEKAMALHLVEVRDSHLHMTQEGKSWIRRPLADQAALLYRHPENILSFDEINEFTIRQAERCLNSVVGKGWVFFDDFIRGIDLPIAQKSGVKLERVGRRWKYAIPDYTEMEIQLLFKTIFERLFQVGVVDIGTVDGKPCFTLTSYGLNFHF